MNDNLAPVYDAYFADPFVWRHHNTYYAVGTGPGDSFLPDGRVFPLLTSDDLQTWRYVGGALVRPETASPTAEFWAPEVAYAEGKFWLYYSHDPHQLRVAVSDEPTGPYIDCGVQLTTERDGIPFAIDASPFQDEDGTWYLFYARDYLDTEEGIHPGTALAVDRLDGMTRLAGEARTVLRARHEWTLFQANRPVHDAVYDWHTLEGAHVRKRNGQYYCLFSGAWWESDRYGVDFAIAEHVTGPYDGDAPDGPRVLRTIPGKLIGPGHNSIVTDVNGREHIVYHAWNREGTKRQMYIEPLEWTRDGPRIARS